MRKMPVVIETSAVLTLEAIERRRLKGSLAGGDEA
jgi:hypothetical protein